jgi:cholesterol transport system auxiliary component
MKRFCRIADRPARRSKHERTTAAVLRNIVALGTLLAITAVLAGCSILPEQKSIALYAPQPHLVADPAWPKADWQLLISRPYADATVDSERILVRPQPGELQVYKGAAWSQSAPDLVHDVLLRAFTDSGRLRGVARRGEGVNAAYELLLDLRRFESEYSDGAMPSVRIELGARLVHNADNRVTAQRVFQIEAPADSTDIAAVNRAFERALGDVATQLVGWTLSEGNNDVARKR